MMYLLYIDLACEHRRISCLRFIHPKTPIFLSTFRVERSRDHLKIVCVRRPVLIEILLFFPIFKNVISTLGLSCHFLIVCRSFLQVNGAFDLPHVRLSGVSTPYVRVHLLPGDRNKESRSSFLNLSTNRICMFDKLTLEEARK